MGSNEHSRKRDGGKLERLRLLKLFLALVVAVFLLFRFVIGFSFVSGVSMKDTLIDGELVFYTRINRSIDIGDIISVSIPSGEFYVKRVVAKAGDVVDIHDGTLFVNGVAETDAHVRGQTIPEAGMFKYPYTVSEGCAFVLGDNREESVDSRYFGEVSLRQVKGVLRLRVGKFFIQGL